jgi:1-acyl-sn-glycerol-3-phosphate acyltransferase
MAEADQQRTAQCDYPHPFPLQFRGSALARWVLARLGWKVHFEGFPALQGMVAVYPHTSNWDFVVMVLAKWAMGVPASFWGKDKLFRIPLFGAWLRWLGGVPVERTSARGTVGQAVDLIASRKRRNEYFWLGLAPEGTRRKIPGWRSGFYRTALQAQIPLGLARLDYSRREVTLLDFIALTGDEAQDMARIASVYRGALGKKPDNAAAIQLLAPTVPRSETIVK